MLCRCPSSLETDDGLVKFTVTAFRRRLEKQLKGSYELVPKNSLFAASDSFSRGLRADLKLKLTVSTWTPEKVYEQFAALYDKNQDQETLSELKEHMMLVGKSRPPKKNASWYAKAYKTHAMIMEAIRSSVEAHPITFKPYAKTKVRFNENVFNFSIFPENRQNSTSRHPRFQRRLLQQIRVPKGHGNRYFYCNAQQRTEETRIPEISRLRIASRTWLRSDCFILGL